jgi:outer membrane immunogenic protein
LAEPLQTTEYWSELMTGKYLRGLAICTAVTLSTFAAQPAQAADLGGKVPMPVPEPIEILNTDWAGVYFGGHLGGAVDGDNDFLGGLHLGYNWQNGNLLYGAEGDISFGDDTVGTIRGRLGFAGPALALYGTAGVAITDDDEGLVAGGGVEYKIAERTSVGVEALHYALDDDFTVIRGRLTWHFGG